MTSSREFRSSKQVSLPTIHLNILCRKLTKTHEQMTIQLHRSARQSLLVAERNFSTLLPSFDVKKSANQTGPKTAISTLFRLVDYGFQAGQYRWIFLIPSARLREKWRKKRRSFNSESCWINVSGLKEEKESLLRPRDRTSNWTWLVFFFSLSSLSSSYGHVINSRFCVCCRLVCCAFKRLLLP